MGLKNPWEPVQTVSNNQTPRLQSPIAREEWGSWHSNYAGGQVDRLGPQLIAVAGLVWPGLLCY